MQDNHHNLVHRVDHQHPKDSIVLMQTQQMHPPVCANSARICPAPDVLVPHYPQSWEPFALSAVADAA